jgi:hypothetical protein
MAVLLSGFVCGKRTHTRVVFCSARHHHIHFASAMIMTSWFGRRALNRSMPSCHRVHTKAVARVRPARSCCSEATRASTLRGPQGAIFSRNVQFSGSCLHIARDVDKASSHDVSCVVCPCGHTRQSASGASASLASPPQRGSACVRVTICSTAMSVCLLMPICCGGAGFARSLAPTDKMLFFPGSAKASHALHQLVSARTRGASRRRLGQWCAAQPHVTPGTAW